MKWTGDMSHGSLSWLWPGNCYQATVTEKHCLVSILPISVTWKGIASCVRPLLQGWTPNNMEFLSNGAGEPAFMVCVTCYIFSIIMLGNQHTSINSAMYFVLLSYYPKWVYEAWISLRNYFNVCLVKEKAPFVTCHIKLVHSIFHT